MLLLLLLLLLLLRHMDASCCRVMEWDGAAMTARRLVSLCCKGGDDDMFSTDLTLEELKVCSM
jgi:hypothetical protein